MEGRIGRCTDWDARFNLERIPASGRSVAQGKEAVCVFQAKAERLEADKRDDGVGVLECG